MKHQVNKFMSENDVSSSDLSVFLEELDVVYTRDLKKPSGPGVAHAYGLNTESFVVEADGVKLKDEDFREG